MGAKTQAWTSEEEKNVKSIRELKSERIHHGDHARGVAGTELAPQGGGTEQMLLCLLA